MTFDDTLEKLSRRNPVDIQQFQRRDYTVPVQHELVNLTDFSVSTNESKLMGRGDLSTFVDYWHQIPKYASRPEEMETERQECGMLPIKHIDFTLNTYDGHFHPAELKITPARIADQKTGKVKDFYPCPRDELIEDILIHIAAGGLTGDHQRAAIEGQGRESKVYVRYSLYEIQQRLKACNRTRSISEIATSIQVLMRTQLEIRVNGGRWLKTNLLGSGTYNDKPTRAEYQVVCLSDLFSAGIWARKYRQFPISLYLKVKTDTGRYLFKQMWDQKNLGGDVKFTCKLSQCQKRNVVKPGSATLRHRTVQKALEELKEHGVIFFNNDNPLKKTALKENGKIFDYEYTFDISKAFTSQLKAANYAARKLQSLRQKNPVIEDMFN